MKLKLYLPIDRISTQLTLAYYPLNKRRGGSGVKKSWILKQTSYYLLFLILLVGCNAPETTNPTTSITPTKGDSVVSTPNSVTVSEDFKITAQGIGTAQLGMTLGELKNKLGTNVQFQVKSPFIVDFDAIALSQAGEIQYYILYPAGKPLTDFDKITTLLTDNPKYRTDKGIGPNQPLKQAETVYGKATLSYNLAMEGREYVSFAQQPHKNIFFRLGSYGDNSLAGIYSSSAEYNQTKQYKDTATITAVRVDCQGKQCAQ